MSRTDAGSLTYLQAWDWFVAPALERQKEFDKRTPTTRDDSKLHPVARQNRLYSRRHGGGFDPTRASKEEMDAFLDKFCGNRRYEGPKWWLPEVAKELGIKRYQGVK